MSILKRELYYDKRDGIIRFWDWAIATTTLGAMAEPFCISLRHSVGTPSINIDFSDELARIDELHYAPHDKEKLVLSGGLHELNGGILMPRVGP